LFIVIIFEIYILIGNALCICSTVPPFTFPRVSLLVPVP
jgi:hypothetical protein